MGGARWSSGALLSLALLWVVPWAGGCRREAVPEAPVPVAASVAPAPSPAAAAPAGSTSALAAAPRVVFLGDSLTAGLGLGEEVAYPAIVGELLAARGVAVRIVNAGGSFRGRRTSS